MAQNKGPIPKLQTERLILRPFCLYDAKNYFKLVSDPRVLDTTDMPHLIEEPIMREWIMYQPEAWKENRELCLLTTLKATREILGSISLFIYERHNKADLGYWIACDHWGKGYATEAASVMIRFAFEELKLHKLEANHLERNDMSKRVLEKLGFQYEGMPRETYLKGDKYENLKLYGLLSRDYLEALEKK